MVEAIHDEQRAVLTDVDAVRLVERDPERLAAAGTVALLAGACDADDSAVGGSVFAHDVIGGIGDDDVVVLVDAEWLGRVERGHAGVAAVACVAGLAGASHGADFPLRIDDAERVARALQDVDVAVAVDRGGARIDQRRALGIGAILRNALRAAAGHETPPARFHVDRADAAVVEVRYVELAEVGVERDAVDTAELGVQHLAAIAGVALPAGPGKSSDRAGLGVDLADAAVPGIGDINRAVGSN